MSGLEAALPPAFHCTVGDASFERCVRDGFEAAAAAADTGAAGEISALNGDFQELVGEAVAAASTCVFVLHDPGQRGQRSGRHSGGDQLPSLLATSRGL